MNVNLRQQQFSDDPTIKPMSLAYWRKGAQHFHTILSGERMRRVHAAEVGETGGRVSWSPTQDVAQLRRVSIDGVPRHQELGG